MSDAIRGGVVAFLFVVVVMDLYTSRQSRQDAILFREESKLILSALEIKVNETLEEKRRLWKKVNHLEYLNRKFSKLEKDVKKSEISKGGSP